MPSSSTARRVGLGLVAVAALAIAAGACTASSPGSATTSAAEGSVSLAASRTGGGWDLNSNEPLLADDVT